MPGRRYIIVVLLPGALEFQEIPVAAGLARELAAGGGSCIVDCAVALIGVKKLTDTGKVFVVLAVQQALVAVIGVKVALFGLFQRNVKMLRNALGVALGDVDYRIGAAITRAFGAVVFRRRHSVQAFNTPDPSWAFNLS